MEWTTESVKATISSRYPEPTQVDRDWAATSHRSWWPRRGHRTTQKAGTARAVTRAAGHAA